MPTYTVTQFYFGQYADLDPVETPSNTSEDNLINELSEVSGWGAGTVFNKDNMQLLTLTQNDVVREGRDNRLEENDLAEANLHEAGGVVGAIGADSYTYDLGGGPVTSDIDSTFTWTIEVTRGDGTTFQASLAFVQLENGAIFSNFRPDVFGDLNVQSIRLVSYVSGEYYGATADRNLVGTQIVCFSKDTLISTPSGLVPAGNLGVGDLVVTQDNGNQPIRWISKRHIESAELQEKPAFLPIRIKAGALGQGLPHSDLVVSPQHRVLLRSRIVDRLYSPAGVLVAAKHLLDLPGVEVLPVASITYVHFAFERHEIVFAENTPVESFYPGPMAIAALDSDAREELIGLFPELKYETVDAIRTPLHGRASRNLVSRHQKNQVPLLSA